MIKMDTFKGFVVGVFFGAVLSTIPSYIVGFKIAQKIVHENNKQTTQQQLIAEVHLQDANDVLAESTDTRQE